MPLDASRLLSAQGWEGRGRPLRPNSNGVTKPVIIAQKKTLSGIGKDRDDHFAFWDHVYETSAQTLSIKISADSEGEEDMMGDAESLAIHVSDTSDIRNISLQRTQTGILSNQRPTALPSDSFRLASPATPEALSTQEVQEAATAGYKMSLMAASYKEAAKRGLYARFFRGPVLGFQQSKRDSADEGSSSRSKTSSPFPTSNLAPLSEEGRSADLVVRKKKKRKEVLKGGAKGTDTLAEEGDPRAPGLEARDGGYRKCGDELSDPQRFEDKDQARSKEEKQVRKALRTAIKAEKRARKEARRKALLVV